MHAWMAHKKPNFRNSRIELVVNRKEKTEWNKMQCLGMHAWMAHKKAEQGQHNLVACAQRTISEQKAQECGNP